MRVDAIRDARLTLLKSPLMVCSHALFGSRRDDPGRIMTPKRRIGAAHGTASSGLKWLGSKKRVPKHGDAQLKLDLKGLNGFAAMIATMKEMGYEGDDENAEIEEYADVEAGSKSAAGAVAAGAAAAGTAETRVGGRVADEAADTAAAAAAGEVAARVAISDVAIGEAATGGVAIGMVAGSGVTASGSAAAVTRARVAGSFTIDSAARVKAAGRASISVGAAEANSATGIMAGRRAASLGWIIVAGVMATVVIACSAAAVIVLVLASGGARL